MTDTADEAITGSTGEQAPASGIWQPDTGGKQLALSEGDVFPPSEGVGATYTLVEATVEATVDPQP